METSASFEARSAPSSYPTIADCAKISNSPHTGLQKVGSIVTIPILGGRHHQYLRV